VKRHIHGMIWDLGRAMRKKEEFESSRLMEFEYRQRARAMRLLAEQFELDPDHWARETALSSDETIIETIAAEASRDVDTIRQAHGACLEEARRQLIGERGDPTPYRLG